MIDDTKSKPAITIRMILKIPTGHRMQKLRKKRNITRMLQICTPVITSLLSPVILKLAKSKEYKTP